QALAAELLQQHVAPPLLGGVERPGFLKDSVGEMRQAFASALNADESLDVRPPGLEVPVANRPIDRDAFARVRLEVEVTPPVDAATPHDRPPADLAPADPVKRLVVGERIRIVEVVDEELARILIAGAGVALDRLIAFEALP